MFDPFNHYRLGGKNSLHRTGAVKDKLSDPDRRALDSAIASIRATAQDQAKAVRETAERQAEGILAGAEGRIAEIEADWAIATTAGDPPHLLNVAGAAKLLGVSAHVVYRLLDIGDLPVVHVLSRRYVSRAAVEDFAGRLSGGGTLLKSGGAAMVSGSDAPVGTKDDAS